MIFHNPVRVEWGTPDFSWLPVAVGTRKAVFVTTAGMVERGVVERIREVLGVEKLSVTSSVKSNPTIASIRENAAEVLEGQHPEVIVALGGGSALDLAVEYAKLRKTFGKPICEHQAIQLKLGEMATRARACG